MLATEDGRCDKQFFVCVQDGEAGAVAERVEGAGELVEKQEGGN